jgi:YHS domain-containing protein
MKLTKMILGAVLVAGLTAGVAAVRADGTNTNSAAKTDMKAKPYPLKTCLVSGDKLGEMGEPAVLVYKGQEFKFCCKDCIKDFNKEPDKWVKQLADEVKKADAAKKTK